MELVASEYGRRFMSAVMALVSVAGLVGGEGAGGAGGGGGGLRSFMRVLLPEFNTR